MYARSHASVGYGRRRSSNSSSSKETMERQAKLREARQTQMMFEVPKTFRCVRIVGKGAYGMVCEAIDRNSKKRRDGKERVAIKKIKEALYHPLDAKLVLRELKISRLIGNHPNILGIRDLIRPSSKRRMDTIYIVSDFMDTDLYRLCQSQVEFTENHVRHLLYQMLCGLSYMHSANILHRDMKTANLLVDRNFNLQICDFGLARFSSPGHEYDCEGSTGSVPEADGGPPPLTELVVTLWYRAPELVANSHYNSSIDLWAVGCIFAEMLLRRPLFPGRDHLHQLQLITDIMGTPTETDIRTIRGAYARKVLRTVHKPDWELLLGIVRKYQTWSNEDKKVKDSAGKGKDMVEFIAKEKAFLAREREELERQTKLAMPLPVPSYLDDKPEVASPVHFNANVNLAPKAASILHKDKAGSPGSEETMIRMEKKKTSPVGGALAAIKAAKAAELDDATVISTPSQKADEPNAGSNGKKKKRSPAGGGLEAVKAVREETKAAEALKVAATALSLLKSPSTIDVYSAKTEKTQSEAESSARMNSMAKRVDEAKASSEQILGNVQLKHSGKTLMDAATALDAALAGISLKSRSSPSLLPVGQSFGKKPKLLSFTNSRNTGTDISNTMGMSRPNPINKKPSRSSSSNDIALLKKNAPGNSNAHGNKKAKENKPWVFRPTELARDRRKRLEREARQNGENIECTNSAAT
eukprot:g7225.t1